MSTDGWPGAPGSYNPPNIYSGAKIPPTSLEVKTFGESAGYDFGYAVYPSGAMTPSGPSITSATAFVGSDYVLLNFFVTLNMSKHIAPENDALKTFLRLPKGTIATGKFASVSIDFAYFQNGPPAKTASGSGSGILFSESYFGLAYDSLGYLTPIGAAEVKIGTNPSSLVAAPEIVLSDYTHLNILGSAIFSRR